MQRISTTSHHHPLHARRRSLRLPGGTQRFLAALEGIEGGFAVGASIIVALSIAGLEKHLLIVTAVVGIVVSGFNSASVKYMSEHYLDEIDGREKNSAFRHYFLPALIEFICYLALSLVAVLPLMLMTNVAAAVTVSVAATIVLMFVAGLWRGYVLGIHSVRDGVETAVLGLGIILIGLISGFAVNSL